MLYAHLPHWYAVSMQDTQNNEQSERVELTEGEALWQRVVSLMGDGSVSRAAAALGISRQRLWQVRTSDALPLELALKIHKATSGQVAAHLLRPDLLDGLRVVCVTGEVCE